MPVSHDICHSWNLAHDLWLTTRANYVRSKVLGCLSTVQIVGTVLITAAGGEHWEIRRGYYTGRRGLMRSDLACQEKAVSDREMRA